MKCLLPAVVALIPIVFANSVQTAKESPNHIAKSGAYIGLEKDPYADPDEPDALRFHENTLLIRNDEAILDKVPFTIRNGKKEYQAADGGFLTYRAKFLIHDGQTVVEMRLCKSMYIIFRVGQHDQYTAIKSSPVKLDSGQIELEGVRYHSTFLNKAELDRLNNLLSAEPLEEEVAGE